MTPAQLTDYSDLITSEHNDKPNFMAVIAASIQPFVDGINGLQALPAAFDIDLAVGAQLDIVGQWVGLSRNLKVPVSGVYFAFNTNGVGWNQGVWFSSDDPSEGVSSLDDGTYRLMLQAKIAANEWDGSLGQANEALSTLFPGGAVLIQDNFDMTETIVVNGTPPSVLFQQLVSQGYIPFKPAAVGMMTSVNLQLPYSNEDSVFFGDDAAANLIETGLE